jgi:putative endopeptidase
MRFSRPRLILAVFVVAAFSMCAVLVAHVGRAMEKGHGFDTANLDKTCEPCKDFNQFANGGWIKNNPIPAAYPSWGTFNELADRNTEALHKVLEEAAKNTKAAKGSIDQKIGDYYASCMDESGIETAGLTAIQPELAKIEKVRDVHSLQAEVAHLHTIGVRPMFRFGSEQDARDSRQVIGAAGQGGLGLPDRDYYVKDDARSKGIRDSYVQHVAKMFELMGDDSAKAAAEAKTVMEIETALAQGSMTRVQQRDPEAIYHRTTQAALKEMTPNISWSDYLKAIGARGVGDINVAQPDFFKKLNSMMVSTPIGDWKTYLRWHLINSSAASLSSKFVDEDFNFKGKTLTGTKENQPRWKRCVGATDRALGEAVGQAYVKENFTPEAKARAVAMVQNLVTALKTDLTTLSWMGDTTRKQAIGKLDAFMRKIGYPDTWRNYSALQVDRGLYVNNRFRANEFDYARDLNKIGKPVDRAEWGMTPPTVNAYYNPAMNEIVFPAGILQPPFFDPKADDAVNYGAIGAVIGHEMTHGFDDEGAKYDAEGNLKNWWSAEDLKNFEGRAQCVVNQFDSFEVQDGLHENGKLVSGESIADLGGLTIAYAAFEKSMEGKPHPAAIEGFTPEQRFFLGYAHVWAGNARPEYERLLVTVDPHPLARFRVNGPLSNMPAFKQAFGCKNGEAMVREDACQIW